MSARSHVVSPRRVAGVLSLTLALIGTGLGAASAAAQEATLDDFAWLAGTWRGGGPAEATAEIHFMPPRAGVLPAVFRLWQGERTVVLEAVTLVQEEDRLVMYVRHFDAALVPLEKERAIELVLVGRDSTTFAFENVNEGQNPRRSFMSPTTDGGFLAVSELVDADGTKREIRVEYRRVPLH